MAVFPNVSMGSALHGEMEQIWLKELRPKRIKTEQQFHVLVALLKHSVSLTLIRRKHYLAHN